MNLLEFIKSTPNHPLQKIIEINEDSTSIISSIDQKEKQIYCQKNNKLEELGKEIFMKMDPRIIKSDNLKFYIPEEKNNIDNRPADLILVNSLFPNNLLSTLEFKSIRTNSKNHESDIEKTFSQAISYSKNLISDKYKDTKETFCVVVLIDVEKIILNPTLIDMYYNSIDTSIKANINLSLSTYGVYTETRKYSIKNDLFQDEQIKSFNIPVIDCFDKNDLSNIEVSLSGKTVFTKSAIEANNSITFSSSLGLGNLREVLNPEENKNKESLVMDIFYTLVEGFISKDTLCLNKKSNSKSFVFIQKETILLEKKFENFSKILFVSTEGALIDGQQSTSIPFFIKEVLLNKSYSNKINQIKENMISFLHKKGFKNQNDIFLFIDFIASCSFNYNISLEKNKDSIKAICKSKNKNIPINNEENFFLNNGAIYKFLSNKIHEETGYLPTYPNISKIYTSKDKTIEVKYIPYLFFCLEKSLKKDFKETFCQSFIETKKISLGENNKNLLSSIIESKFETSEKANELKINVDSIKKEILHSEEQLRKYREDIEKNSSIEIKNLLSSYVLDIEEKIESLKLSISEKNKDIKVENIENIVQFSLKNEKETLEKFRKIIEAILFIQKELEINKSYVNNIEVRKNLDLIVFRILLNKHKGDISKINGFEVLDVLQNLFEIKKTYSIQWTSIRNIDDKRIYQKDESDKKRNITEVFDLFFKK